MGDLSAQGAAPRAVTRERDAEVRSTDTKASTKTSEFFSVALIVFVVATLMMLRSR